MTLNPSPCSRSGHAASLTHLLTYVVFHLSVMFVHELKKSHFYLGLIQKSLLVLYDFNGNPFLLHTIIGLYNLKEKKEELNLYFINGNNFPAVDNSP